MIRRRSLAVLAFAARLLAPPVASAQSVDSPARSPDSSPAVDRGFFVAYEVTEMAVNRFRHVAGEIGRRVGDRGRVRVSAFEVDLTERDLAGWWSASVDGAGVRGYFRAYELNVDRFVGRGWYVSANAGYIANTFEHVTLPDRVANRTLTAGAGFGYSRTGLFGVKRLYFDFSNPVRYYVHGIAETRLGAATVRAHRIVPNTWAFIGYQF